MKEHFIVISKGTPDELQDAINAAWRDGYSLTATQVLQAASFDYPDGSVERFYPQFIAVMTLGR